MHYYFIQIILIGSILLLLFLDWCQCSNHKVVCSVYKIKYIIGIAFLCLSPCFQIHTLSAPHDRRSSYLGYGGFQVLFFFFQLFLLVMIVDTVCGIDA